MNRDQQLQNQVVGTFTCSRKSSINSCNQDVHTMAIAGRTQGDGSENEAKTVEAPKCKSPQSVVKLIPNTPILVRKEKILNPLKSKEPKFVPYEPYKAAINPIVPPEKGRRKKNDLNINAMASKLVNLKTEEQKIKKPEHKIVENVEEIEGLKEKYKLEMQKLKEENSQLENQLKFQAQVNGELKNLLVAAVGEDLENKVHLLTEDKLQLAQALLDSSKHLSTHQEQTEWLAGQCEVWRSKFLASSLMVEELAKWKAALSQRTTDLQEAMKRLLEECSRVRETLLRSYRNLSILRENFDPFGPSSRHKLPSTNFIDVTNGCCQLTELLKVNLLSGMENLDLRREIDSTGLEMKTTAEKQAEQLLMTPNVMMSGRQDAACSAVVGAAVALGGNMFLSHRKTSNVACCQHCSGEMKLV